MKVTLWLSEKDEIVFTNLISLHQFQSNVIFETVSGKFYLKNAQLGEVFKMVKDGFEIREVSRELE